MEFKNISNASALLSIERKQIMLSPGETVEVVCAANPMISLSHDYPSSSLTVEEIRHGEAANNTSVLDLLFVESRPPYFQIVLDSTYQLFCPGDATVSIRREKLRPRYFCVYDRFFPDISQGEILEIKHNFSEKPEFINRYKQAVDNSKKGAISALVSILAILGLPIAVLILLANLTIGIIVWTIGIIGLVAVYFIANHIVQAINETEQKVVLSNFESEQITKHFFTAREKYPERIQIN